MIARVENINPGVLRQCREQIGLSLEEVMKKIPGIGLIESGKRKPTFKQLDSLADLYTVPRWVFISEFLPEPYQFDRSIPAFRQFAKPPIAAAFNDPKVRALIAKVERLRHLILELRDDMGEPIKPFALPLPNNSSPSSAAMQVRQWLEINEPLDFPQRKEKLEGKDIFVFMTSKYKGWSHIDKERFRGLAIFHATLPIIIINDSDYRHAQSFTLFHELGHLLRRENSIDDWNENQQKTERWCDKLAGNVLMPVGDFICHGRPHSLDAVKWVAKDFKVSHYACLVRFKQLRIIDQETYQDYKQQITDEYLANKQKKGRSSRDRPKEVLNQYGQIYTRTIFQSYHNQEIGLHKLCKLFDLKQPSHALKLEEML